MFYRPTNQVVGTGVILMLIGVGLVVGLVLIGSDFARPLTNLSEFMDSRVERQRAAQQQEIDVEQYEARQEAITQAEIARRREEIRHLQEIHAEELRQIEEQTQYLEQLHDQELQFVRQRAAHRLQLLRVAGYSGIAVVGLFLFLLGIALSVRVARARPGAPQAGHAWTADRRRRAIAAARRREREQRRRVLRERELDRWFTGLQGRLQELERSIDLAGHDSSDELLLKPFFLALNHGELD